MGRWSHYIFPFTIQHFAHFKDTLYLRHGDKVSKVIEAHAYDDGQDFESVIQWPWLDFGSPGRDKQMMGFDNVGDGVASIEVGYNQANIAAFTESFEIPADSEPGQIIPLPITAPSFSVRLTYKSTEKWEWMAMQMYVQDLALGK